MTKPTNTPKARWINNLLAESAKCTTRMPWERGLRRAAMIDRRNVAQTATPLSKRVTS